MIRMTLRPQPDKPGRFECVVAGEVLLRSRQPILDGARMLIARGETDDSELEIVSAFGSPYICRWRRARLAEWAISEGDASGLRLVEWKPFDASFLPHGGDQGDAIGGGEPLETADGGIALP